MVNPIQYLRNTLGSVQRSWKEILLMYHAIAVPRNSNQISTENVVLRTLSGMLYVISYPNLQNHGWNQFQQHNSTFCITIHTEVNS